jgi:hypothetical protein
MRYAIVATLQPALNDIIVEEMEAVMAKVRSAPIEGAHYPIYIYSPLLVSSTLVMATPATSEYIALFQFWYTARLRRRPAGVGPLLVTLYLSIT